MNSKRVKFDALTSNGYKRRKHFPAFRNDLAIEIRCCRAIMRNQERCDHDRFIARCVLRGILISLARFKANTQATQQALWADLGATYALNPP